MSLLQEPYLSSIVLGLFLLIILIVLWYKNKKKFVLETIKYLVNLAEIKFGSGTGELKYAYVISNLYPKLPFIIKLLLNQKTIDEWITKAVDELQKRIEQEIEKN